MLLPLAAPPAPAQTAPVQTEPDYSAAGRLGIGASLNRDVTLSWGLSDGSVLQAGVGYRSLATHTGDSGEDRTDRLFLGAAFQPVLVSGDRADLGLDLGLDFASVDDYHPSDLAGAGVFGMAQTGVSATVWTPRVGLLVRYWASRSFTLSAGTGIAFDVVNPSDSDSRTNFRTAAGNLTEVSFHFWFDPK